MILIWYNYFLHIFNILKKYCIFANKQTDILKMKIKSK